jgi:hypothetical protein
MTGCSQTYTWSPTTASATPTPSGPVTQVIWQNGSVGCWGGNCGTGAINTNFNGCVEMVTGTQTLEIYTTGPVLSGSYQYNLQNAQSLAAFANGHVLFSIMLAQPASSYTSLYVGGSGGSENLNISTLSNSVELTGSTTAIFEVGFSLFGANLSGESIFYINNIEFTSD